MSLIKSIKTISLVCFSGLSFAQGGAAVRAFVDKNRILIGEPFQLTIEIFLPAGSEYNKIKIDSIPHFELLNRPQTDTLDKTGGLKLRSIYRFTSFDSGHWVIPSIILFKGVNTDTIPIDILFSEFNRNQDYHDIKDIISVKKPEKKNWLLYSLFFGAGLLTLLYFLRRRKQPPVPAPSVPGPKAYEEAMQRLKELQQLQLPEKEFHTRLVDIFKQYVLRKKNILSQQKTTEDLVRQLQLVIPDNNIYTQLHQALRLSDFVKFAKFQSTPEENISGLTTIINTIKFIEQSDGVSSASGDNISGES